MIERLISQAPRQRFLARERTVTTGERQNDLLPVMSGLSTGERIVVDGVMLLRTEVTEVVPR